MNDVADRRSGKNADEDSKVALILCPICGNSKYEKEDCIPCNFSKDCKEKWGRFSAFKTKDQILEYISKHFVQTGKKLESGLKNGPSRYIFRSFFAPGFWFNRFLKRYKEILDVDIQGYRVMFPTSENELIHLCSANFLKIREYHKQFKEQLIIGQVMGDYGLDFDSRLDLEKRICSDFRTKEFSQEKFNQSMLSKINGGGRHFVYIYSGKKENKINDEPDWKKFFKLYQEGKCIRDKNLDIFLEAHAPRLKEISSTNRANVSIIISIASLFVALLKLIMG